MPGILPSILPGICLGGCREAATRQNVNVVRARGEMQSIWNDPGNTLCVLCESVVGTAQCNLTSGFTTRFRKLPHLPFFVFRFPLCLGRMAEYFF
jgi:hypothetical protein